MQPVFGSQETLPQFLRSVVFSLSSVPPLPLPLPLYLSLSGSLSLSLALPLLQHAGFRTCFLLLLTLSLLHLSCGLPRLRFALPSINQAWWPVVPRVGDPQSDGIVSNYVVVGRAPGLDLTLHEHDFAVLWQVSFPFFLLLSPGGGRSVYLSCRVPSRLSIALFIVSTVLVSTVWFSFSLLVLVYFSLLVLRSSLLVFRSSLLSYFVSSLPRGWRGGQHADVVVLV